MASGRKKVLVRRFQHDLLAGYLPQNQFVVNGNLELLDLAGRVIPVPLSEIKMVCYVRDFNLGDRDPEKLTRKTFLARPRNEGVHLRLTFKDEDVLEGLANPDLSLFDSLLEDQGFQFAPPDIRSNVQRIYVPRRAVTLLEIVAVVTTPSKKKEAGERAKEELQERLFGLELPANSRPN